MTYLSEVKFSYLNQDNVLQQIVDMRVQLSSVKPDKRDL